MRTDELDFELPSELIAQEPAARRSDARLLCYDRNTKSIQHRYVRDLPDLLRRGDLLVFNHTTVVPARFTVVKPSGGKLEGLWLSTESHHPFKRGRVLLKGLGNFQPGVQLSFEADPSAKLTVLHKWPSDGYEVEASENLNELIRRLGRMPLPPYIKRAKGRDERDELDRERYQTVINEGVAPSVAAPTAGLHFDDALLYRLEVAGVEHTSVELQVGLGTFKPVDVEDLDDHPMHRERWEIEEPVDHEINDVRRAGGRIVAVGTTAVRTLESQPPGDIVPGVGETDLLIQPPYDWKHVDAMVTNFHLPRSTLLALVAAFVGLEEMHRIYAAAIEEKYRFFSYGDAMLLT